MAITQKSILDKTSYGLGIYAFILRRYYPGEVVLRICGRECNPTKNPFNDDRPSLKIKVRNNIAIHTDYENAIADGNAFDFASRFYSLDGEALLKRLNDDMYLHLDEEVVLAPKIKKGRILSPQISYFSKPISNIYPLKTVTLEQVYELIKGTKFLKHTSQLRLLQDKNVMREYKSRYFDYVTFSGIFSERKDQKLVRSSNLLTIDIDEIRLDQIAELKQAILSDSYFETELLFISPSGRGLKWIIPFDAERTNHAFFFNAVANYLKATYKIKIDRSGRDQSRACFLPHDPNCYIHPKYL